MASRFRDISPPQLLEWLGRPDPPRLIDVRERWEWDYVHLPQAELKPLSDIAQWWTTLDPAETIVFQCHHGNRSRQVCIALAAEGFGDLYNLAGGIEAWAAEVAPGMARY